MVGKSPTYRTLIGSQRRLSEHLRRLFAGTAPEPPRERSLASYWNSRLPAGSLVHPGPIVVGHVGVQLQAVSCGSSVVCTAVGSWVARVGGGVAEQSALATAQLTGVRCDARAPVKISVTGDAISSVTWSLDGRKIKGRRLRPGTRYAASVRISLGRHKVKAKVKFKASSETHACTFLSNRGRLLARPLGPTQPASRHNPLPGSDKPDT